MLFFIETFYSQYSKGLLTFRTIYSFFSSNVSKYNSLKHLKTLNISLLHKKTFKQN